MGPLIFHIFSPFFPTSMCLLHVRAVPLHSPLSFLCSSPHFPSFYLIQTVIVERRVQMFHSVPPSFSTRSCKKSHEPNRMRRPCQTSSLWTQQKNHTNARGTLFMCVCVCVVGPRYLARCLPNGSARAEWRSERRNGNGVKAGSKQYQGYLADVLHHCVTLSAALSRRRPQISSSLQPGLRVSSSTPLWQRHTSAS